jgi:OmpA-OmpF porin, OOP family
VNGIEDEDGCPDEGLVQLIGDRVVLEDHVLFALGEARVQTGARPIVRALAQLVLHHPEWVRVRVEGHADVRGTDELNLALTVRRAANVVRALVDAGVPATLLTSEGFGRSRPRDVGTSEAAHTRNRRVEFIVETAPTPQGQP